MDATQWAGLLVFGLGVATNAGIVWKGLGVVERELNRLREAVHMKAQADSKTLGSLETEMDDLKDRVDRIERKVFGA